jgi:Leucine-rich repeat (LRR) protein/predicted Ser/Thr protein kinase
LETVVTSFEEAWLRGDCPTLNAYLAGLDGDRRFSILVELAHIELEFRLKTGEAVRVEEYLRRYPELEHSDIIISLLAHEYRVRQLDEPSLTIGEYLERFPRHAEDLGKRLGATLPTSIDPHTSAEKGLRSNRPLPEWFGRYRILKPLGEGGMGTVYLAHDSQLDRPVALKIPRFRAEDGAPALMRFLTEARAAAVLRHRNICPVYDAGKIDGIHYLTMAYIEGRPLSDLLHAEQRFSPHEAVTLVRKQAVALQEAHACGVIHRDLKPSNIMIDKHNEPILMDFGLARKTGATETRVTQSGLVIGTPAYMSPEQANGEVAVIGPETDIYSLGVILYELLAGQPPFKGPVAAVLGQIATASPQPPSAHRPDLDPALEAVCLKAMAKTIVDRYPSMADFAGALSDYLQGGQTNPSQPYAVKPKRTTHRSTLMAGIWGATVGVLGVLLVLVVLKIKTSTGTLIVEVNEPDAVVQILNEEGKVEITRKNEKGKLAITVDPGKHRLRVEKDGFQLFTQEFTVEANGKSAITAKLVPIEVKPAVPALGHWMKEVASLPTEKQVEAVAAKLKELNPGFDGKVTHQIEAGEVMRLEFVSDSVTDISPVRALPALRELNCSGQNSKKLSNLSPLRGMQLRVFRCDHTQVADLSPLQEMPLTFLHCEDTFISDLSPLKGMNLETLVVGYTKVSNLSPLQGMPLKILNFWHTEVRDLSPLKGMKLSILAFDGAPVSDLSPLQRMPLAHLYLSGTRVRDLSRLKGMPLTLLVCRGTPISDLSPLSGMPLTRLECEGTSVSDLSPLKGMPLKELGCDFKLNRDTEILRSLASLEKINGKPANEFWNEVKDENGEAKVPRNDTERQAAVLALKVEPEFIVVELKDGERVKVKRPKELPVNAFRTRELWFRDSRKIDDTLRVGDALLGRLCQLASSVEKLALVDCSITNDGLAYLHKWSKLRYLKLNGTRISDAGLTHLAALSSLKVLYFDNTSIGNNGLAHLSKLKLEQLVLAKTYVTNDGLKHLTEMPLVMLDLNHDKVITNAGLNHLMALTTLRQLKVVDTMVTDEGIRRLKAALPDCQVSK